MAQTPVETAITYQGELKMNGTPLTGTADVRLRLYDAATGGAQVGSQVSLFGLNIANGLFTILPDFGVNPWTANEARWLEIDVRSPAGGGPYTTLSPRTELTATPFSMNTRGIAVSSDGSVGIGTNAPTNKLTVSSNGDFSTVVAITSGSTAPQSSSLRLNDRGNPIWSVYKTSGNDFAVREISVPADRLFIQQGGSIGIGTTSPEVRLQVQGGTDASLAGGGFIVAGDPSLNNLVIDNNEIMARDNGATSTLYLNNEGGDVVIASGAVTRVSVLEITGGADLAEGFDIRGEEPRPGEVVVIDPDHPGSLRPATRAYDRRVAGVISGAGGVRPGMVMAQEGSPAAGKHPVALTGRVYTLAEAVDSPIEPGDLLTTSNMPGHAMEASDPARASGAILGKAMTGLPMGERGLVLVLISLQ
jgi:hypothetical protein